VPDLADKLRMIRNDLDEEATRIFMMIINSFPKIVKDILRGLPKNDYPVLNSRLFFECSPLVVADKTSA